MRAVDVTHDFALPVERVYACPAEHDNLGPLFGAHIRRVRDGFPLSDHSARMEFVAHGSGRARTARGHPARP